MLTVYAYETTIKNFLLRYTNRSKTFLLFVYANASIEFVE